MIKNKLTIVFLLIITIGIIAFLMKGYLTKQGINKNNSSPNQDNKTSIVSPKDKPQIVSTKPDPLEKAISLVNVV